MDDARKFSLKDKIKHFLCLACCFTTGRRETLRSSESTSSVGDTTKRPLFLIGGASVDLPDIKLKCHNLISRIGNGYGLQNHHHRRRRSSADFSYDPLSYALNFEEDACEDDAPIKNFSSRLPSTPPPSSSGGV